MEELNESELNESELNENNYKHYPSALEIKNYFDESINGIYKFKISPKNTIVYKNTKNDYCINMNFNEELWSINEFPYFSKDGYISDFYFPDCHIDHKILWKDSLGNIIELEMYLIY